MNDLVGTRNCPHLGFDLHGGRPCCHADDMTRNACGKQAPNPAAKKAGAAGALSGVEAYFCTVLGTDSLPPEALRLAAQEKAKARQQPAAPRFEPPGRGTAKPNREQEISEDADPVIPTHTLRNEGRQAQPNQPCPCGSGKKFKKCCGR